MPFEVDFNLLEQARIALSQHEKLYWLLGGAGAGKTSVCGILSKRFGLPVYDMDSYIYGEYHARFTTRHPVNRAWVAAPNSLTWLLEMSWEEFDQFNRAALPEYLDLLAEDLQNPKYAHGVLVDGGVWHPALLAQAIPPAQIVCLVAPEQSSEQVWQENEERQEMKAFIEQLPMAETMWRKFLEFDALITANILRESSASGISICTRGTGETAAAFAECARKALGIC